MTCSACPFAFTEVSAEVQNLGCLPTPFEAMEIQFAGKNWCCHEDETRPCAGQAAYCREEGIPYNKHAPLASYTNWYQTGAA